MRLLVRSRVTPCFAGRLSQIGLSRVPCLLMRNRRPDKETIMRMRLQDASRPEFVLTVLFSADARRVPYVGVGFV